MKDWLANSFVSIGNKAAVKWNCVEQITEQLSIDGVTPLAFVKVIKHLVNVCGGEFLGVSKTVRNTAVRCNTK